MKGVAKGFAKTIGVALVLALLAWTGTFLYWHFRIRSAIRVLEDQPVSSHRDGAVRQLASGGCRSLSYLVAALDPAREQPEIWVALHKAFIQNSLHPQRLNDQECVEASNYLEECRVDPDFSPRKRAARAEWIRSWWKKSGSRYHQWWRVWSSCCPLN
ncbi:MAG: hypothetical protein HY293_22090 [Planctomycetes bacterium]|nr:hypothetical protein [Planctomycetota bacterium]